MREAALHGPGFKGERRALDESTRRALMAKFKTAGEPAPAYLQRGAKWLDREAKLFEAGDYPDKGIEVTPADLSAMAERFDLPVPVLIEHAEGPLSLGYLTDVRAQEDELFGTISLTEQANELIEQSEARSLSIGLSEELDRIVEVSLVRSPQVASARIFGRPGFVGTVGEPDWESGFRDLRRRQRTEEARSRLDDWIREGRIAPAQAPAAQALLGSDETLRFGDRLRSVAEWTVELVLNAPRRDLFSELAPEPSQGAPQLPQEERDFYTRHFPGLDLDAIARAKAQ